MGDYEFKDLEFKRRKTRQVKIGNVPIGGGAPIVVQSMTKTHTQDVADTINQIRRMEDVGCEIVRLAVPDMGAAYALRKIKKRVSVPLIADIHFDHTLALAALDAGIEGLRINPGNMERRLQKRWSRALCIMSGSLRIWDSI
jgi:(E)-4-hydroxy-3-methylbut-2-enyl-diphosphate synthase